MSAPDPLPASSLILYQTEDGQTRIQCRFENETIWLTQAQMAELFQTTPQNVTLHLKAIFTEGELDEAATCKDYLQVRPEGSRQVTRSVLHYSLPAILAVGFRIRSQRGTQFRQWATARLNQYPRRLSGQPLAAQLPGFRAMAPVTRPTANRTAKVPGPASRMKIPIKNLAFGSCPTQESLNRTRQGYARKRILKPAGRFFYTLGVERMAA